MQNTTNNPQNVPNLRNSQNLQQPTAGQLGQNGQNNGIPPYTQPNQNNEQPTISRQNPIVAQPNNTTNNQILQQQPNQNAGQTFSRQNLPTTQNNQNQLPQPANQIISRPNQGIVDQNQIPQPANQIISRPNQGIVGYNNVNNPLGSRQSKLSPAGIQAANEPIRQLQQPAVNPQPISNVPQHNIQSRQSKLSVLNNERPTQAPAGIPRAQPTRPIGSRQSKLSLIGQQDRPRANDPFIQNRNPIQEPRRPIPISRQSKLSVIDGDQRPQALPRLPPQPSRRSNRSVVPSSPAQKRIESPMDKSAPNFQTRNRRLTPIGVRVDRAYTASTTALSTYSNYETLQFFPLVVGREDPEIFSEGIQNQGWMSEPDANYPIDVILGFDHICNVYKVYLTVTDHLIPSKVEIRAGNKRKEDDDPTYATARSASYELKATMRFERRITDLEERETKVAFIDSECQYLWFLFHAPHASRLNPTNQIRVTGLTIEGYQIEQKRPRVSRSVDSFRSSLPPPSRRRSRQHSRSRQKSRGTTAISLLSNIPSTRDSRRDRKDNGRISRISLISGSSIGDGEGWKSNGENLASDPLMAVRLVRNLLKKKKKRALKRGRDVEATVCLRAVETLNGYEKQMSDIRRKMSEALQQENIDEAKKQELALIDCRDTAFRVIHLDLLLEKTELRAIGVQSKWSPDTSSLR